MSLRSTVTGPKHANSFNDRHIDLLMSVLKICQYHSVDNVFILISCSLEVYTGIVTRIKILISPGN